MPVYWARMGGVAVTDAMVLLEAKLGPGRELIEAIARRKVAAALAWEKGVKVEERDVEEVLEAYYRSRGVEDPDSRRAWNAQMHIKEDALRSHLRELALIERLRGQIVTDADIQTRYRETLAERRLANVRVFDFTSETGAKNFISAVLTGDFEPRLGERHRLPKALVPAEIAADLATASEGQLLGPAAIQPGIWRVYRFQRWDEPPLDVPLKEEIREELFRELLAPAVADDPLSFLS